MSIEKQNIKAIQASLQAAGFTIVGEPDGIAGKNTVSAVMQAIAKANATNLPIVDADKPAPELSKHFLSEQSLQRLSGIKTQLRDVVKRAIQISETDFMVVEGLRTRERQAQLVKSGASQILNSRHLTGDAVDIVPYVNGKANWGDDDNWARIYQMAAAMKQAAEDLQVNVTWGGAWVTLNNRAGTPYEWVESYKAAKRKQGKKPFMDGVHFELTK